MYRRIGNITTLSMEIGLTTALNLNYCGLEEVMQDAALTDVVSAYSLTSTFF